MKKLLVVVACLAVIAFAAYRTLVPRFTEYDRTARQFARSLLEGNAIGTWNAEGLRSVSSTELAAARSAEDFSRLFAAISPRLGPVESVAEPVGGVGLSYKEHRKQITAEYAFAVQFAKAEGVVTVGLLQEDDEWKVQSVRFDSPALSMKPGAEGFSATAEIAPPTPAPE